MKKLIPLLLALTLLLSLGMIAFADGEGASSDYTPGDGHTMQQEITTTIPEEKAKFLRSLPRLPPNQLSPRTGKTPL